MQKNMFILWNVFYLGKTIISIHALYTINFTINMLNLIINILDKLKKLLFIEIRFIICMVNSHT